MNIGLQNYGFVPFFAQQLTESERLKSHPARVTAVERSELTVTDGSDEFAIPITPRWQEAAAADRPTVGDWVILKHSRQEIERVLERKSVFRRVAAGIKPEIQTIAANVDVLFIVTSCNDEFKESRLERYLAVAAESGVMPVIVLTKIDLSGDPDVYADRARGVQAGVPVEQVNALDGESLKGVSAWIDPGSTIALVGSSGVGKSTLLNALAGANIASTMSVREQDQKGRHTTSSRSLHRLPGGGLVIDVPGIRELKVANVGAALRIVFDDIEDLASRCRFADCSHQSEPDCAVRLAVEAGDIDERRLRNYLKLVREDRRHSTSLAEQRKKNREFGKMARQAKEWKEQRSSQD